VRQSTKTRPRRVGEPRLRAWACWRRPSRGRGSDSFRWRP
jgi:hypothetical protein